MSPGSTSIVVFARQPRLLAAADEHVLGDPAVVPAEGAARARAPSRSASTVNVVGRSKRKSLRSPSPPRNRPGAVGVLDEREPRHAHRVVQLGLLDRRVLGVLAVRLHRVGPVARRAAAVAAAERLEEAVVARRVAASTPPKPAWHIIAFVPAGSRSGSAGRRARKITSTRRVCVSQPPTTGLGQRAVRDGARAARRA